MCPRDAPLLQSTALSFRTHLQINMCQQHQPHSSSMDEQSIGSLCEGRFAPVLRGSIVQFQLPTIIRCRSKSALLSHSDRDTAQEFLLASCCVSITSENHSS